MLSSVDVRNRSPTVPCDCYVSLKPWLKQRQLPNRSRAQLSFHLFEAAVAGEDFSLLEKGLEEEAWEVEGDDEALELRVPEARELRWQASYEEIWSPKTPNRGLRGTQGDADQRRSGFGGRAGVNPSTSIPTVGLAYDDDLEEAVLLVALRQACTIRRPRPESKLPREPGSDPPEEPEPPKPVALHVNGQVVEDLGELPRRVELDVRIDWKERTTVVKHKLLESDPERAESGAEASLSTGFYTTHVPFDAAKAVFLRATGSVTTRLVSLQCHCGHAPETSP
eukprot:Skav201998  [mRNA]  locus=scaffold269:293073:305742:+ [translate_table: standard]